MSVMFPGYFGVPQKVIRGGLWRKMKPSEQSLYICLLHESERCTTRELRRTDAQLGALSGISSRAFSNARKKLQERGLVLYKPGAGNVYIYTICNPETGRPWPDDPKIRVPYKRKGDTLSQGPLQPPVPAAGWKESKKPAASLAAPRSVDLRPSSIKPNDRLEDYGLPLSFQTLLR